MEKRRKILFIYICLLIGILGMEAGGLQYNLLLIGEELGLSTTQMGNLVSAKYLAFITIPLALGGFADKYGKKIILVLFGLCFSLGSFAIIMSSGFLLVLAGVFLMGAGYAMCESVGTAALADMYGEDASRYINWSQSFFSIGALLSPVMGQFMGDVMGLNWRVFYYILMYSYVFLALWATRMTFPKPPKTEVMTVEGENEALDKPQKSSGNHMDLSTKKKVIYLAVAMTLYAGMESGIAYFIGTHMTHVLGTESYNSLGLSLFWLLMIPSRYLVGVVKKAPRKMLMLSYIGSAAFILVVVLMTSRNALLIGYALMGFCFAPIWPLIMGEAGNLDPANSSRIAGTMTACCGLGGMVAPTVFGILADNLSLTASLLFVFAITISGFIMSFIYNRSMR